MGLAAFSEEDKKCVAFVIGYPVPTVQAVVLDAANTACTPCSCDIGTASGHYTDFVTACPKACTTAMYANFDFASGLPDCGEGVGDWDDSSCADDSTCVDWLAAFSEEDKKCVAFFIGYPVPTVQAVVLDAANAACTPYSCEPSAAVGHYVAMVTLAPRPAPLACTLISTLTLASRLVSVTPVTGTTRRALTTPRASTGSLRFPRRTRNALPFSLGTRCRRSRLLCWTPPTPRARLILSD